MKLGLMAGDVGRLVQADELRPLGFEAVQAFFGFGEGATAEEGDPSPDVLDALLDAGDAALAAMTLHVDLVGPAGRKDADVARAVRCVEKTAALEGRFGANARPVMIWHPSGYPAGSGIDDRAVFEGLCDALATVCQTAERRGVDLAIEITRAGSVGSAETFLRIKDRVDSAALRVCMDAANFTPDRTPLGRAVRMLGPDIAIAHGKDVRFDERGEVADYGPAGSGTLDYPAYIQLLTRHSAAPYFVLEYYRTREDLLVARDIVLHALQEASA